MCKNLLRMEQMTNADVARARSLAGDLLRWETRGPGDTANAMRRLSTRYGLPYGTQWALRYRPPKRLWSDLLACIAAAHAAEKERQLRKLAHEAELTEAVAGTGLHSVAEARALLRQAEGDVAPLVAEGPR